MQLTQLIGANAANKQNYHMTEHTHILRCPLFQAIISFRLWFCWFVLLRGFGKSDALFTFLPPTLFYLTLLSWTIRPNWPFLQMYPSSQGAVGQLRVVSYQCEEIKSCCLPDLSQQWVLTFPHLSHLSSLPWSPSSHPQPDTASLAFLQAAP